MRHFLKYKTTNESGGYESDWCTGFSDSSNLIRQRMVVKSKWEKKKKTFSISTSPSYPDRMKSMEDSIVGSNIRGKWSSWYYYYYFIIFFFEEEEVEIIDKSFERILIVVGTFDAHRSGRGYCWVGLFGLAVWVCGFQHLEAFIGGFSFLFAIDRLFGRVKAELSFCRKRKRRRGGEVECLVFGWSD